ncbi:hypothetical protein ACX0G7_03700 [Flavitalea antarctica]
MNDHQPYDQSLRDKLNRLPVPDMQKSWQEMRMILDDEMPEDGKSRRRGGWWFFSAILLFISAGSWTLLKMNFSKQNVYPPLSATKNTSPPPSIGQETKQFRAGTQKTSEKPGVEDDKILLGQEDRSDNKKSEEAELIVTPKTGEKTVSIFTGAEPVRDDKVTRENNQVTRDDNRVTRENNQVTRDDNQVTRDGNEVAGRNNSLAKKNVPAGPQKLAGPLPGEYAPTGNPSFFMIPVLPPGPSETSGPEAAVVKGIERLPLQSVAESIDSINQDYGSYISYAPVSRKYYRQHKKYGRPANVRPPYTTVGRNFALGFSLPLVFPVGDQQALSYNVNARPNTTSDYIPAPHAQFHFNGKVYVQSELQIMSPQYIKPALLYLNKTSNSMYNTTSSISAEKLYYFNVPFSLHYSPFKHFYMGTGLQFSSLLSGVAMHEQVRTGMVSSDSVHTVSYSKFANDSISDKLSGSEMRLMLDANYYWNKFTVGLRYNQALSNYVSMRAAPMVPMTVDKNKSIQFYLRYNLWEDKKKKNPGPKALVVK